MNGVHDMGGMHGFGPIVREENEPLFHEPWEARAFASGVALRPYGISTVDEGRREIERIPPARYLTASYYERQFIARETNLIAKGVISAAELDQRTEALRTGQAPPIAAPPDPAAAADRALAALRAAPPLPAAAPAPPRFVPGDAVLARNLHPLGHTRLARYVRGKRGVIDRVLGVFPLPDAVASGAGILPETCYAVRFTGSELWGAGAEPNTTISIDLWDSYLDPAPLG